MLTYIMMLSLLIIWVLILLNQTLIIAGYLYCKKAEAEEVAQIEGEYPFVSIMIPAHNEGKVIGKTVESLLKFEYPKERYEVIVINDNSSDNSKDILEHIKWHNPNHNLELIHTDKITGGRGKSNALNIGFKRSRGEYILIYDADNTPEPTALRYLVASICSNERYGAVVGKFRTRNRDINWLTRCINIETLSFQWMAQAGRWRLFKLCTIPGTNFIVRRSIIEEIGGWDEKAIAEDTEISFRIYKMGYLIKFFPKAVTWEQEPQTLKVWFKQRTRWAKGNIYVLIKNIGYLKDNSPEVRPIKIDLLYFLSVYFLLLTALVFSDFIVIYNILDVMPQDIQGFSLLLWWMTFISFILSVQVSIVGERGEAGRANIPIIISMYFIYTKFWMIVSVYALFLYIKDVLYKQEAKWYKTERF